jgi:hypothetical protein
MAMKHPLVTPLTSLALLVCLGAPAQAATIASSTIRGETGNFFQCVATNVSSKDREVTLEIRTFGGVLLADDGPQTLLAGRALAISEAIASTTDAWCKITVQGAKSAVRGTLNLLAGNTSTLLESIVLQ